MKLVDDARAKGARVIEIAGPKTRAASQSRAFPPTIVLDVTEDMSVAKEEIFGPILPILGIVGAFVATYLGQAVGWYGEDQAAGLIGATIGALLILLVWGFIERRKQAT